jgi:hypothetical protein
LFWGLAFSQGITTYLFLKVILLAFPPISPILFLVALRAIELTLSFLKALVRASEKFTSRGDKYNEILNCIVGVAFLGTPFQGSWNAGYTAAQLRIAAAIQTGSEHSQELVQYLGRGSEHRSSPLDELVQRFCEMTSHNYFKFKIVCFYETRATNFCAVLKRLPEGYAKGQLDTNGHGIVGLDQYPTKLLLTKI